MSQEQELEDSDVGDLERLPDVGREGAESRYADAVAKHEELDNKHRESLFKFVVWVVSLSLVVVGCTVICLGLGILKLASPVAVAFISAVALQSFLLISSLARGLFPVPSPGSKHRKEAS